MALSYELEMKTEISPIQALCIIADKCGLEWQQDTLRGPGILVKADTLDDLEQSVTYAAFGFRPTLAVGFRIDPNQDYELGMGTVLRSTTILLQQVVGDAVLLFDYEIVVATRIGNQLAFNKHEWDMSIASLLPEMTAPYELRDLPSPLL